VPALGNGMGWWIIGSLDMPCYVRYPNSAFDTTLVQPRATPLPHPTSISIVACSKEASQISDSQTSMALFLSAEIP
jgi:hypothetical protein